MKIKNKLILILSLTFSAAVFLFLVKPQVISKESRDQKRIEDLETLKKALDFYLSTAAKAGVPVESLLCTDCSNSKITSFRALKISENQTVAVPQRFVNGSGWVKVDLSANMKIGQTPLKLLPVDPYDENYTLRQKMPFLKNFFGERDTFGYTFTAGKDGKYKLTAKLESSEGLKKAANDQGNIPDRYEIGSDLNLKP